MKVLQILGVEIRPEDIYTEKTIDTKNDCCEEFTKPAGLLNGCCKKCGGGTSKFCPQCGSPLNRMAVEYHMTRFGALLFDRKLITEGFNILLRESLINQNFIGWSGMLSRHESYDEDSFIHQEKVHLFGYRAGTLDENGNIFIHVGSHDLTTFTQKITEHFSGLGLTKRPVRLWTVPEEAKD